MLMLFSPYDGRGQSGFHHLSDCLASLSTWGETRASGQTRLGALGNGSALPAPGVQEAAVWAPGTMGCGHKSPHAPGNMYSSAESIPSLSDVVARSMIHT
jgi:hypothetical protein